MKKLILTALAAIVGTGSAAMLLTNVPAEESGRVVEAVIEGQAIAVRHLSGPEYLSAYRDIVGVWTICDGITAGVRAGQIETREGCLRRLEHELVVHAVGVMACTPGLRGPGHDHVRYAAVSLAYNVGVRRWCASTAARRFNSGDYRGGCEAIGPRFTIVDTRGRTVWRRGFVLAHGREVRGLINRRARERAICLQDL